MAFKVVFWKVFYDIDDQSTSESSKYVKSPPFEIKYQQENGESRNLIWNLSFHPHGLFDSTREKSIAVFTRCKNLKSSYDGVRSDFDFQLTMVLLDRDEDEVVTWSKTVLNDTCKESRHYGFPNFATRAWIHLNREKLLVNNQLTIRAEFTLYDSAKILNVTQPGDKTVSQLSAYKNLFTSGDLSDLMLVSSDNEEFKVHRVILACHSNVFRMLMESNDQNNRVEIPQFKSQVLSELLRYIYTKKVEDIDEFVFDLYLAADHFQLPDLKHMCYRMIINNLNMSNVLESMKFAKNTQNKKLLKKCLDLMKNNWGLARKNLDWNSLTSEENFLIIDYLFNDIAEIRLNDP